MLTGWAKTLLDTLTQFTGESELVSRFFVNHGIAAIFYLFLFAIASAKYQTHQKIYERILKWGFAIGLCRELCMIAASLIASFNLIAPANLNIIFLPLGHTLLAMAMMTIAAGYLYLLPNKEITAQRYLKCAIATSLLTSFLTLWWQTGYVLNTQNVAQSWVNLLFHMNAIFWLSLAIFFVIKYQHKPTNKTVLVALGLFVLSQIAMLSSIVVDLSFSHVSTSVGRLSYLLALLLIGYSYIYEGIDEHKLGFIALQESEAKLNAMLKNINDLVWLKDPNGVYLACNAMFERFYGAKEADIIGKTDYDFVDRELADFFRDHDRKAIEKGGASMNEEWVTYADDGHLALVETTKTPMWDQAGNLIGVLGIAHDITVHKNLETQGRQFQFIVNSSQDAIISKTKDSIVTSWNYGAEKIFGYTASEMIGQSILTLFPQELRSEEHDIQTKIYKGQSVPHFETVRLHKSGRNIHISLTASPIYDETGEITGTSVIGRDITERIVADRHIQRLTKLYKALSVINQAIVHMERQEDLFPLLCRCTVEYGGLSMAWVGQLNLTTSQIKPVAIYGAHPECLDKIFISADASIPAGQGPAGISVRENRQIVCNDVSAEQTSLAWRDMILANGWNAICTSPINRGGKPFAVLCVYDTNTDAFDSKIVELLEEMCTDIAFALDNFDHETQRQIAEESQRLAASVYKSSSEAMVVTNANREIVDVNPAFTEITGYTKSEIIGKNTEMLRSPEHDEEIYPLMREQIHLIGKWQGETWAKRKSNEVFPIWLTCNTIYNDDESVNYRVSLFTDISQKKKSEELIWRQANLDSLTGLPNRQMFNDRLSQEIKKSNRSGLPLALLFLDLDNFKEINDTLGHSIGDKLLQEAAHRILACIRQSDTMARLGGDEFTAILGDLEDINDVYRIADNILKKIQMPFKLDDEILYISTSIGITFYPTDATDADSLIKNADQAMYAAKKAGRNHISFFTRTMQNVAEKRMRLLNELHHAMYYNQIWVAYQPIVNLKTGRITKAEALARWDHPMLGSISPTEFIPLAEHSGLIIEIGDWIFKQAMLQVKRCQIAFDPAFQISVNKSPLQVTDKHEKTQPWHLQLKEANLSGRSIVAEITEGLLLESNAFINLKLIEFRDAGIQVALDDFGTGYSSLSYLQKFDIDYIKIDQSFVKSLGNTKESIALCEAIIVMAHKLGMKVIAEGIETHEQREILFKIGCDFGQGYFFSKPLPAKEFEALLNTNQAHIMI
ncbi:MAG: EAL domain-containing protein [Methylophilus sp.]|nr:EAL domain-containing protein [Methylophilus sp.]